MLAPWKKSHDQPSRHIKKQRHYFADKDPSSQSYGFSSSHVWMWELDDKESCVPKDWCFWTMVLDKSLIFLWTKRRSNQSILKEIISWIFIERTDAEPLMFWPPDAKNWLTWKDPDAGKDWRWEEKGATENEMVRWHHRLNGHWYKQVLVMAGKPGVLQSMGCRVGHNWETELNWTKHNSSQGQPKLHRNILLCRTKHKMYNCLIGILISTALLLFCKHIQKVLPYYN